MSSTADTMDRPSSLGPLFEVRALLEVATGLAGMPALKLITPRGDGHPVFALPPFMSDDKFMTPMRSFLGSLGYDARSWGQGQNTGILDEKLEALTERVERTAEKSSEKVSLIGHSLGGIYARMLAHAIPHAIRQVIYLGSPFKLTDESSIDLPIRKMFELLNPAETRSSLTEESFTYGATPVPSTAVYSEGDGFLPWRSCMDDEDAFTENIRVPGSHAGMPFNLSVLYAVADRLAQSQDNWQPFSLHGLRKFVYGVSSA